MRKGPPSQELGHRCWRIVGVARGLQAAIAACLVGLLALAPPPVHGQQDLAVAEALPSVSEYERLCRVAKALPQSTDYIALRRAYVDVWSEGLLVSNGIYERTRTQLRAYTRARDSGRVSEAEQVLDELLSIDFGNAAVHALAAEHFERRGAAAKAELHREIRRQLLDAMITAGDGRTPESAFPVTGKSEAYQIMRLLGITAAGEAIASKKSVRYQILFVAPGQPQADDRQEVWFKGPW